jgi:hypothetical protein
MCGVDPAAVKEAIGEVVGEAPTWTQWWSGKRSTSHRRGPDEDGSMVVIEERAREWRRIETTRVRVLGAVVQLKRRIVVMDSIDYVNTPITIDEK